MLRRPERLGEAETGTDAEADGDGETGTDGDGDPPGAVPPEPEPGPPWFGWPPVPVPVRGPGRAPGGRTVRPAIPLAAAQATAPASAGLTATCTSASWLPAVTDGAVMPSTIALPDSSEPGVPGHPLTCVLFCTKKMSTCSPACSPRGSWPSFRARPMMSRPAVDRLVVATMDLFSSVPGGIVTAA